MPIIPLAQRPEYIATLAALHLPQWQASHPGWGLQDWENEFRRHLGDFPCTLMALDEQGELLGSASLVADDMNGTAPYSPWLANVLVLPAARGRGVGSALISAIEEKAKLRGLPALYLFTEDQQALYRRRGWLLWEESVFEGKIVSLMRKAR
jgi:GNAT superfamily N-acetyltransferase